MVLIDSGIFVDLVKHSGADCTVYDLVELKCRTDTLVEREIDPLVAMQTVQPNFLVLRALLRLLF